MSFLHQSQPIYTLVGSENLFLTDNHSLADAGDMEHHPFRVVLILDYQVNDLGDMSSFVEGPIYVVDWDCSRWLMGLYVL